MSLVANFARICIVLLLVISFYASTGVQVTPSLSVTNAILSAIQQDPPPLITNYAINVSNSVPDAIIAGSNSIFWFTEIGAGNIGKFSSLTDKFSPPYVVPEPGAQPATLALDGRGLVWFTDENQNSPSVWYLNTTSGTFHKFPTGSSHSDPIFVMVDPTTDYVWFTDYYGNYLGEITGPNGTIIKHTLPGSNSYPVEIAKQNGTVYLWFTEATGKVARFDTSTNTTQEFTANVPLVYPVGIVVDKTGNVWVSEHGGSSVTEFIPSSSTWKKYPTSQSPVSPGTGVATLAMDGQGRLWFAEHYSNRIGRLDTSTGEMDEFNLPIPGAYSLLDSVDSSGNFWFTEANANEIGVIPGNATLNLSVKPDTVPAASVTAGSSTDAIFTVTNNNQTSSVTVDLNVTSSFTTNYYTTRSEVSLSTYRVTLAPGQSQNVSATFTPDFSLGSGLYSAGVVVAYNNASTLNLVFLNVTANPLYTLQIVLPWILIGAGLVLLAIFLVFRRRRRILSGESPSAMPKTMIWTGVLTTLLYIFYQIGPAWAKCPGLPPPPGGSGPDPYGIALDVGSIAFFAVVAYFLIRSRMRESGPQS